MCTPLELRFVSLVLGAASIGCGSGLTLPADGSPAALTVVGGNGQEGTVGSRLDEPLIVLVTDANSNPLAGVPVDFAFETQAPEAEVSPTQAMTDSDGRAAAEVRLGASAGSHIVEAVVATPPASGLRATFALTAVEPGRGKGGGGGDGGRRGGRDDDDDDDDDDD